MSGPHDENGAGTPNNLNNNTNELKKEPTNSSTHINTDALAPLPALRAHPTNKGNRRVARVLFADAPDIPLTATNNNASNHSSNSVQQPLPHTPVATTQSSVNPEAVVTLMAALVTLMALAGLTAATTTSQPSSKRTDRPFGYLDRARQVASVDPNLFHAKHRADAFKERSGMRCADETMPRLRRRLQEGY